MADSKGDLRRERRINLQIPVRISGEPDYESFYISSLTQLSEHGAFISTSASFKTGAIVKLDFDLPEQFPAIAPAEFPEDARAKEKRARRIQPVGRITWQGTGDGIPGVPRECHMGIGIHFVEISDDDRRNIHSFVHHFLTRNGLTAAS